MSRVLKYEMIKKKYLPNKRVQVYEVLLNILQAVYQV